MLLIQPRVREGAQMGGGGGGVNEVYLSKHTFWDNWLNFIMKTWLLLLHFFQVK